MIIYKIVDRKHELTDKKCPVDLDRRMKKWWKSMKLCDCNHAILCFDKKGKEETLIGFFRFIKYGKDFLLMEPMYYQHIENRR